MKKFLPLIISLVMALSLVACSPEKDTSAPKKENAKTAESASAQKDNSVPDGKADIKENKSIKYDPDDLASILSAMEDEFKSATEDIENKAAALQKDLEGGFGAYNPKTVEAFYKDVYNIADALYTKADTMSIDYYKCVAKQYSEEYDWDVALDDLETVCIDNLNDFHEAWTYVLDDIYESCDTVIEDAYENDDLDFDTYYDTWEEMYDTYWDEWDELDEQYWDIWDKLDDQHWDAWEAFSEGKTDIDEILDLDN